MRACVRVCVCVCVRVRARTHTHTHTHTHTRTHEIALTCQYTIVDIYYNAFLLLIILKLF